jgi:hypothetical protein
LADVDPARVLLAFGSDERAGDGSFPVGDGAEDRAEADRSGFDVEPVDPDGRNLAVVGGVDALASATLTAFS